MKTASDLPRRVGVAVVGIPVVFGALYVGGWVLGGLVALAAFVGALEFYRLARARGGHPFDGIGVLAATALVLGATAWSTGPRFMDFAVLLLVGVCLLLLGLSIWQRWPDGSPLDDVATTLMGVVYTGGTLAFVPLLRQLPETWGLPATSLRGAAFVLLPLLAVWASDSAAYFVGHAIGRTKLAPHASPGKTIEGSVAGLVGAMGASALVAWWAAGAGSPQLAIPTALGVGLALGVSGQVGDLAESVLKRQAGVKDSGRVFPGHGGVLDRLDALLFAFPVAWMLFRAPGVMQ